MLKDQPLSQVIFFSIDQTNKKIKQYAQKQFNLYGINITTDQWVLLKIIEENNAISQVALAELALKDTASITRMVDILEKKALVSRNAHTADRRKFTLMLTQKGISFIKKHMPVVESVRQQGIKNFSDKELTLLKSLLEKIADNMD
jgi:DNA-binding MarR family transcriptional regulator